MNRLLRAVTRPIKRLIRPLRLRYVDFLTRRSCAELERLSCLREDLHQLERNEHFNQVQLEVRRQQIERGFA